MALKSVLLVPFFTLPFVNAAIYLDDYAYSVSEPYKYFSEAFVQTYFTSCNFLKLYRLKRFRKIGGEESNCMERKLQESSAESE